ncbi:MAG: hypothetical protein R3A48_08340 [Polyangiales bacterium]
MVRGVSAEATRVRRRRLAWWGAWAAVIVLVLEVTARRYIAAPFPCLMPSSDPEAVFALRPGTYVSDGYLEHVEETRYVIAADGCQHSGTAPSLLTLGSSHGFGLAVPQRDAFPDLLRRELAARGHALHGTRNCSVPGQHFLQQARVAERAMASETHPVAVILVAPHHLQRAQDWSRLAPRSATVRWITTVSRVARLIYLLRLHKDFERRGERYEPPERLAAGLDRLVAAARSRGTRLALVTLGEPDHRDFDLVREARARGITVIRLGWLPRDPSFTVDEEHWSRRGHRVVATRIAPGLDALLRESPAR